jgi:hypothetical protein
MARTYTQNVTTRRNAVAILAIAPLAAAISVSPAPLFDVEKLHARLEVMRRNGLVRMHVSWGPKASAIPASQQATDLLEFLDAPRLLHAAAPGKPSPFDVREFAKSLA